MSILQFPNQKKAIQEKLKCNGFRLLAYYYEYGFSDLIQAFYQTLDKPRYVCYALWDTESKTCGDKRVPYWIRGTRSHFTAVYNNDPDRMIFAVSKEEALEILLEKEKKAEKALLKI
jgi:hypothetical protein